MKRGLSASLALAVLVAPLPGLADEAASALHKAKKAGGERVAEASLHVTPGGLGTPWTFEITNDDTTPLRFVTDGRLLTLDVTRAVEEDAPRPVRPAQHVRCALPAEVRPTNDAEHVHVIVPGSTYVEEFDPRLYCFDGVEADVLAPGSRVVAHLGWPSHPGPQAPPFVVDEIFGGEHRAGVKELTAEAVTTPDVFPEEPEDDHTYKLEVTVPSHIDAETQKDVAVEVTVMNLTRRPLRLMLRPETLTFKVMSPYGVWSCAWRTHPGAPIAEVFTELLPRAKASTGVLLSSMCPDEAFRRAGLYTLYTRVDTRHASGSAIGIDTFDGRVPATGPTLVRIRHTRIPMTR